MNRSTSVGAADPAPYAGDPGGVSFLPPRGIGEWAGGLWYQLRKLEEAMNRFWPLLAEVPVCLQSADVGGHRG